MKHKMFVLFIGLIAAISSYNKDCGHREEIDDTECVKYVKNLLGIGKV